MNCIKFAKEYINEKGFKIIDEDDGSVIFKYQLNNIHMFNNDEDDFLFVSLPNFTEITAENVKQVIENCNKINSEIKMIKLYVVRNLIIASAEIFSHSKKDLFFQMEKALKLLVSAKVMYNDLDD